jgi:DNA-binding response OmpR family regulator
LSGAGKKISVLVIDDEAAVRALLRQALEAENFEVFEANDKSSAFNCIAEHEVDLITLDWKLDNADGMRLAEEIRASRNIPIVMITGRGEALDRVVGLERGADDYVVKPFHPREVILRIRQVLKRYGVGDAPHGPAPVGGQTRFAFHDRIFDARKRELRHRDGTLIELTALEFQLLDLFLQHPGRVFSRDEIMRLLIRRDWSPFDRTVDGHVARLRRKIEPPGDEPTLIKSVRNVGYVFAAEVSEP